MHTHTLSHQFDARRSNPISEFMPELAKEIGHGANAVNVLLVDLRAAVGAGESRMNREVVIRTTYGLVSWLKQQVENPVVVIGCDARYRPADYARR